MIPHILVIDHRINLPRFIAMELRAEGYQVTIHCSDLANLASIQAFNPDVIVLNWELRGRSSSEVYRQLRLVNHQVPVVVITAKDEGSCQLALDMGANTCLTKPFLMNDLLDAIEYHLESKKQLVENSIYW